MADSKSDEANLSALLSPADIALRLKALHPCAVAKRILVGFSGGGDSTALLHALAASEFKPRLHAVHVDHQLQSESPQWAQHCRELADDLGIPCEVLLVDVDPDSKQGPEAAARAARYRAFEQIMKPDDCLVFAQHRDDQAETLLLQVLRGAGSAGLAGMPTQRRFGDGWLLRPLLDLSRSQLRAYIENAGLPVVDDPHNDELGYDRVFIRQRVLPLLEARWPAAKQRLAASAAQLGEDAALVNTLALADINRLLDSRGRLQLNRLLQMPSARQRAALRQWIRDRDWRTPPAVRLASFLEALQQPDNHAELRWGEHSVRRFAGRLYRVALLADLSTKPIAFAYAETCNLPAGLGELRWNTEADATLWSNCRLRVEFRQGGETLRVAGQNLQVKEMLRQWAIVPWMRSRIPLVYRDDILVSVADRRFSTSVMSERPPWVWKNPPQIR